MWLLLTMFAAEAADGPVRFRHTVPVVSDDERAEALTEASITRLEELLRTPLPDETRAELLLRLAELTASQARRLRLREMEATGVQSASLARQDRAIALYRAVLREFPRYARADEAALALGYVLEELGRSVEADEALKLLVRSYPESTALPDAWLLLGEHAFDAGNVYAALKAYQRAAAAPGHPKAAYALYKLAWSQYNVGEHEAAARTLQRVVVQGLAVLPEDTVTLRMDQEALADLPRFFADAGLVEEGRGWFASIGRPELARRAEVMFADLLRERGDWDGAALALRRLLLDGPDAALHATLVRVLEQAGRHEDALAEVDRLLAAHGPTDAADELLRRLAGEWHVAARKHRRDGEGPAYQALAEGAYRRWVGSFADRAPAAEVRYGYGELLYALGRWREAYDQYVAVVELDPRGPRAAYCAESAVFAAEALVGVVERPIATEDVAGPQPLTKDDQRLLEACARYAALDPGPKVADAVYKAGYLLYHRRHFDEAAERFRTVIALDPRSPEAEYAAHLVLDALALQESWEALASTALAFAAEEHLGTAAFRAEVRAIAVNASFRRVEAGYERDRDAGRAGEGFEAFATAFPDQALAMQALHDAAVRYGEAGRFADELRVRAQVVDDPRWGRRSPWYAEDLRELGFGLEQIADFAGAADRYEALWALPNRGDAAAAQDAIWSAAVFRHALGETARAAEDYAAFAGAAADPRRFDARLRAARLGGDTAGLLSLWEDGSAPAEVRLAAAWSAGETMRPAERDRLYGRAVTSEGDRSIVARMRTVLAEPPLGAYRATAITGTDDETLGRTIGHKVRAFRQAEAALQAVIDTGDGPEGLAALVTMGELYRDLSQALEASPTPAHLTPEQATMYGRGVHDQAWSLEERAVDAFALALDRSADLGLYVDATARAVRALGLLRPEDFGGLPEELPPSGLVASVTGPRPGFETALE